MRVVGATFAIADVGQYAQAGHRRQLAAAWILSGVSTLSQAASLLQLCSLATAPKEDSQCLTATPPMTS